MNEVEYYSGRADGIGNRVEEIIGLEAVCDKTGIKFVYIWNNRHNHRHYPILLEASNVIVIDAGGDHDFHSPSAELKETITQADVLSAAKRVRPKFDIRFADDIRPLGVHIRGTDRIGKDHPHFIKDDDQFSYLLSKTIKRLNSIKPRHVFICSDDEKYKKAIIKFLDKDVLVVEPTYDKVINKEYADFFALALCERIYMCSKFSSFSVCASLIGNIPLVSFSKSAEIEKRYKALFDYDTEEIEASEIYEFKFTSSTREVVLNKLMSIKDRFFSLFINK